MTPFERLGGTLDGPPSFPLPGHFARGGEVGVGDGGVLGVGSIGVACCYKVLCWCARAEGGAAEIEDGGRARGRAGWIGERMKKGLKSADGRFDEKRRANAPSVYLRRSQKPELSSTKSGYMI